MLSFKKFLPGIAWFFLVLVLLCLPGDEIPKGENWMDLVMFDKWVHIGLFGILGFLFMLPVGKASFHKKQKRFLFARIAVSVSIWGLALEFVQKYYIPGRTFDLLDWAADSMGALLAFFAAVKLFLKAKRV